MSPNEPWYDSSPSGVFDHDAMGLRREGAARIFLAEDDADLRMLIGQALRRDGYGVIEVADGLELLDCLRDALSLPLMIPDVIITDVMMPRYSGLGVLRALRRANWFTPVIVVSALGDKILEQARELGATAFLKKPFAIDDLRAAVLNASLAGMRARRAPRTD